MDKIIIYTNIKNDNDLLYIDEWINYHRSIGIDNFLINYHNISKPLPEYDFVEYLPTNENMNIYDYIKSKYNNYTWYINLNIYEFINIKTSKYKRNLKLFLHFIEAKNNNYINIVKSYYTDDNIIYKQNTNTLNTFVNNIRHRNILDPNNYIQLVYINKNDNLPKFEINSIEDLYYCNEDFIEIKTIYTKTLEEYIIKCISYNNLNNIFSEFFNYNNITKQKIIAIPELLKKYNLTNYNINSENNKIFVRMYNLLNKDI